MTFLSVRRANLIRLITLVGVVIEAAIGGVVSGGRSLVPITKLAQQADVVVLGTVTSVATSNAADATLEVNVGHVLQGQPGAFTLTLAIAVPFADISPAQIFQTQTVGRSCIWFLKANGGVFRIMPLVQGLWTPNDVCLPVASAASSGQSAAAGTVNQQLLAYLIQWYQSLSNPSPTEDEMVVNNLAVAEHADSISALTALLSSPAISNQIVALAAAIRTGSDDALVRLAAGFSSFQSNPKIDLVVKSLRAPWPPRDIAAIPSLQQLASLHADVPGFDVALASSLAGIRNKGILPAMAQLLGSKDPQAQRAAATFFGKFALLADKQGNLPAGGPIGPFASPQTMQYTPRKDSTITSAEYAAFWQDWWTKTSQISVFSSDYVGGRRSRSTRIGKCQNSGHVVVSRFDRASMCKVGLITRR